MTNTQSSNLNNARSEATRTKLVQAAIESLVELGYTKTTGVEVCRRAGVTRGALNHQFPVYIDLLIAAINRVYATILEETEQPDRGRMEHYIKDVYKRVIRPEFKAVIELWLASQNDPDLGDELSRVISENSKQFAANAFLDPESDTAAATAFYYTCFELMIGIGLGRATSGGKKSDHEDIVVNFMIELARQYDQKGQHHD